ncbi:HpcH/HpaI aldolase/citrate lyase family protein [Diaminobutyricibacter sp. McL0618]|uniref:HpcH/HpaI aldolase/citrate lyase family protein n=1 Tax=Leifsonia sp. McL0618 TaxID=3415677 RepID=UPI003CF342F3
MSGKRDPISYLFVPASRPDRYGKACDSAADAVIIDLEDAVAADEKDEALEHLRNALEQGLPRPVHVRINSADSRWFDRDIAMLDEISESARDCIAGVFVPKAEDPDTIERVRAVLGAAAEIVPIIESAAGVARVEDLSAVRGVTRFAVGAADLSFDLDTDIASATIDWVYARLVVASRVAGLAAPVGSPPFEIKNLDAVRREAVRLRGLGATAQLCIHPAQIAPILAGFLPSAERVDWARRVMSSGGGGASQVDGQMIDKPLWERARRILAQAAR